MLRLQRLMAVLVIASFSVPTRAFAQPAQKEHAATWRALVEELEPAALVEVRLKDGTRLRGTLVSHRADRLTLTPHTRIPVPPRDLRYDDIAAITRGRAGLNAGTKVLIGVGTSVAAFLMISLALLAGAD